MQYRHDAPVPCGQKFAQVCAQFPVADEVGGHLGLVLVHPKLYSVESESPSDIAKTHVTHAPDPPADGGAGGIALEGPAAAAAAGLGGASVTQARTKAMRPSWSISFVPFSLALRNFEELASLPSCDATTLSRLRLCCYGEHRWAHHQVGGLAADIRGSSATVTLDKTRGVIPEGRDKFSATLCRLIQQREQRTG